MNDDPKTSRSLMNLAGRDYFTVPEAAAYCCISESQWRSKVQKEFPPGEFYGKLVYRRSDVQRFIERSHNANADRAAETQRQLQKQRARRRHTPRWADRGKIAAVYREARRLTTETGKPHQVDHEIPLLGKRVSGLHIHENLRVVPKWVNDVKGNKW